MDQSNQLDKLRSGLLTRKNLLVLVGIVLVLEFTWAVWKLTKPVAAPKPASNQRATIMTASLTSILLQAPKTQLKIGEQITVGINISSKKATDGTDIILIYDPKILTVVPINGVPVALGTIYNDYPVNSVDEKTGRITISGITSTSGGVIPQGLFGQVTFRAKATGSTKIAVDFAKGKTTESNVIETKTAIDILDEVRNLDLNILP